MKIKSMAMGLLITSVSLAGGSANAGYNCKSYDGKSSLSLYNDYGLKVMVRNEQGAEVLFYAEQTANEDSDLYSKAEYDLHTPTRLADEAVLTVVSRVQGSSDGSGSKSISAKLKHHETETHFNCAETNI